VRLNIYSQELTDEVELGLKPSNTGIGYSFVRMFLKSAPELHHPPQDDDRSAITFWLPKSMWRREELATAFEQMAELVRRAPNETGLD
jgi:hypothetical protein